MGGDLNSSTLPLLLVLPLHNPLPLSETLSEGEKTEGLKGKRLGFRLNCSQIQSQISATGS